jgi:predicted nucleotidyltransferase
MHRYRLPVDFTRPVETIIPGVQGRILAVLAETSAELNLRTIARLARVSPAQASRVLPTLVELGIVERREAPPSALFRFVPDNVGARAVIALAGSRQAVLDEMRRMAGELVPSPASVIVFGSFARAESVGESDLDVVVVRAKGVENDDLAWRAAVAGWTEQVRRLTGNRVEVIEVSAPEAARSLRGRSPLWLEVQRDGVVVFGAEMADLTGRRSA